MGKKHKDELASKKKKDVKSEDLLTDLAIERTELTLKRIQLAWNNSLIGLMATGFAFDKGLQALHQARIASGEAWIKNGHAIALVLTLTGITLLIPVTFFYIKRANELARLRGHRPSYFSLILLLSYFVISLRVLLLYFMQISDDF
jgi:uncharacterized membrane protein YidH (DUF202 family)